MRRLLPLIALIPAPMLAAPFERPVPQGETGTAAISYAVASLALVLFLAGAQWLISRR
jgi:hypothetical protein